MNQEALPTDYDVQRAMKLYHACMNPNTPPQACSSCGVIDIPIEDELDLGTADVLSFQKVNLSSPLLEPLRYTDLENEEYERPVPQHIVDTVENQTRARLPRLRRRWSLRAAKLANPSP